MFSHEFALPDPETGELSRTVRAELLRLPRVDELREDFVDGGVRIHSSRAAVKDRFQNCLLVESREGLERRREYYKEGMGLVALEVYEPGAGGATGSPGRLIYGRYLKER